MKRSLHQLSSPRFFYFLSKAMLPWVAVLFVISLICGLIGGLILAPPDYQQGDAFRIIYIHVPCAFLSIFIYLWIAFCGIGLIIWRIKLADVIIESSLVIGASFTALALITGSIWGKPMWGAWWVWDARLTSELILLFLYLGVIALRSSISNSDIAAKVSSYLLVLGLINIPIIHYSVYWWNTLHQGSTLNLFGKSLIDSSMLYPLLAMIVAFFLLYLLVLLLNAQYHLLIRERKSAWVRELIKRSPSS